MRITTLASGSSGNCTVVSARGKSLLIDAGISMRRIKAGLASLALHPEELSGVLITHEHSDHISGLSMLLKYYGVPVYAAGATADYLRRTLAFGAENVRRILPGEGFFAGGMEIRAFRTPHDACESVGYRVSADAVFALCTDMGCVTDEIRGGLHGADAVLIEANHDEELLRNGSYPYYLKRRILSDRGHLSNEACAALAARLAESGTRYIVLGHLSRENNTPERAARAVKSALKDYESVTLCVAPQSESLDFTVDGGEEPCSASGLSASAV